MGEERHEWLTHSKYNVKRGSENRNLVILLPHVPRRRRSPKATQRGARRERDISEGGRAESRCRRAHRSRRRWREQPTADWRKQARGKPEPRRCRGSCRYLRMASGQGSAGEARQANSVSMAASGSQRASLHSSRRCCRSNRWAILPSPRRMGEAMRCLGTCGAPRMSISCSRHSVPYRGVRC